MASRASPEPRGRGEVGAGQAVWLAGWWRLIGATAARLLGVARAQLWTSLIVGPVPQLGPCSRSGQKSFRKVRALKTSALGSTCLCPVESGSWSPALGASGAAGTSWK